ncbi:hypothetical protein CC85DRAFT_329986 [Cutaneotrichosporon oleaginosum]|uniref:Uncharacterized protein n=1 Tax=Cutaneotrichosporon oleaginosum TaxID=879819 RepID=A0A0J0XGZ8_9TREE|nr:uncharacterized protein CC85DRAFT_329986 [Cutaneotrichosporon oleaginosum]KLT40365.1 hypothetical protein CC85DRAFT_329986 [Cutaneotrichosporon oleaginosum]TXT06472.1 hypothetical protein COLE_05803 [Cutaneotrichosporon oleaginosum]
MDLHTSAYDSLALPAIGLRSSSINSSHSFHSHQAHGQASPPSSPYTGSDEPDDYEVKSTTRIHKMRSKRDSAKYQRQQDYLHDRSLLEVMDSERCDRCHRNGWRCFIEADADSPRRVCRPCGKNKCSFGNTTVRPATKSPRWEGTPRVEHDKPKRYEPYTVAPRAEPLPGVAALTAWQPLTPPTEREGSLELLAEAAHRARTTPLPEERGRERPRKPSYDALPFSPHDVENDHRFLELARHYAHYVLPGNRYNVLAHLYKSSQPLPAYH